MQTAEASIPQPARGIPERENRPCTEPSSPFLPWRIGRAASTDMRYVPEGSNIIKSLQLRLGEMTAGVQYFSQHHELLWMLSTGPL